MSPRRQVFLTLGLLALLAIGAITAATTPDDLRAALLWLGIALACALVLLLILVWANQPLSEDELAEQELEERMARHRAYPPAPHDREGASA